ncbi:MAG TPA: hypothetical protein VH186_11175 [Chloroflexia bacterium]|nr:hypothetical protein [Chloroflexia bacterium]
MTIATKPIKRKRNLLYISGMAGFAWAGLFGLIFLYNTGNYDFWFPGRIITYVMLLLAPALTFIPIGRMLEFPFYGYWAVISWALFGYVLAFVPTNPAAGWNGNTSQISLLLIALFMVTVTIFLPIFYRLGFRLFSRRIEKYDLGRSRREAILAGLYVLLIAFLRIVGALNPIVAFAALGACVVLELLILSRNFGRE